MAATFHGPGGLWEGHRVEDVCTPQALARDPCRYTASTTHERAGSQRLLHLHGELNAALCASCGERHAWTGELPPGTRCPASALRPDIVFFGEMPHEMDRIERAPAGCGLFVSIGTSGAVYQTAGFVRTARRHGADTLELNLEPSAGACSSPTAGWARRACSRRRRCRRSSALTLDREQVSLQGWNFSTA